MNEVKQERLRSYIDELRECFREMQEYKIQYDEAIENASEKLEVPKPILKKVVAAMEKRNILVLQTESDQVSELITELMSDE